MPDSQTPEPESAQPREVILVAPHAEIHIEEKGKGKSDDKEGGDEKKEDDGKNGKEKKKFRWTPLKILIAVVVGIVIIVLAVLYILSALSHETTDDAYTTGFVHQISSRVTSNVIELDIVDNQHVNQGDVLLRLDPRDFQVQVDKAQADYDKAKADFDRVDALKNDVAISKQDYDQTKSNFEVAAAALEDAKNQLSYCTIRAPSEGYIGNRTVNVGNRVQVGGALMSVVQGVWVLANFKETQLGKMKEGQQVAITVDAIPSHTFPGYINSFSPGTGSTFALLPPDNATGNFTKIVQRVPVKILFDPNGIGDFRNRLVPGLSVEISVDLNAPLVQEPREVSKLSQ
jgi:membrane fusion protein (multidrug efflux system)